MVTDQSFLGMWHRLFIGFSWNIGTIHEIPVIPETIAGGTGQVLTTYPLIGRGEIVIPGGARARRLRWESFFPNDYDHSVEHIPQSLHRDPQVWLRDIERVQRSGWMQVTIKNTNIDGRYSIEAFDWSFVPGSPGDMYYQISLVNTVQGVIREFDGTSFPTLDLRPPPYGQLPETYTSIQGQSLADISLILFGTTANWVDLFEANVYTLLGGFVDSDIFLSEDYQRNFYSMWDASKPIFRGTILKVPKKTTV